MKKAFTLIELLVVIAIIAILAAILFPVFAQAKAAAKNTQDLSNVKNLGLAVQMYLGDSDDVFPLGKYPVPGGTGDEITWQDEIYPYVKNGDKQGTSTGGTKATGSGGIFLSPGYPKPKQQGGSYAIHYGLAPNYASPGTLDHATVSSTSITLPADKVMIFPRGTSSTQDANTDYNWPWFLADEWNWVDYLGTNDEGGTPTNPNIQQYTVLKDANGAVKGDCDDLRTGMAPAWDYCGQYPRYRFTGNTNAAFIDGHAKSFKRTATGTSIQYGRNIFLQGISNGGGSLY